MPVIKGALRAEGALVDALLGWSAIGARGLRTALRPVPPPRNAHAVLDTGAESTCVDSALIQALGLPFAGAVLINLPAHGGMNATASYDASLTIVHPSRNPALDLLIHDLSVLEVSLAPLGYQAIIGRDVLSKCRFFYNGPGDKFMLAY